MFGSIGTGELLVLLVVALIFLGPERLPSLARTLGRTLTEFRRTTNDIKRTLTAEMGDESPYHPPPISDEMKRRIRERTAAVSREERSDDLSLSPYPTAPSGDGPSEEVTSVAPGAPSDGLARAGAQGVPETEVPPLEVDLTPRSVKTSAADASSQEQRS